MSSCQTLTGWVTALSPPLLDFQEHGTCRVCYGSTNSMNCRHPGKVANHQDRAHGTKTDPSDTTTTADRHRHENAPIVAVQPAALQMGKVVKSPQSLSCYHPAQLQMGGGAGAT